MKRVGFFISFGADDWLGGVSYFNNLFHAVSSLPDRRIEPIVFSGLRIRDKIASDFSPWEVIGSRQLDEGHQDGFIVKVLRRILKRDLYLSRLFKKHNVSLLSHINKPFVGLDIPTIGWIPDFQHKHLPEFFSREEVLERDRVFTGLCRSCACVLVSSHSAQEDLGRFFPQYTSKSRVLQFVANSFRCDAIIPLKELEIKYQFKAPFFYIPNHFWAHKNHQVVVDALGLLKTEGYKIPILLTGKTNDYRNPGYYGALMGRVKDAGLVDVFRVLGIIPYPEVVSLMHHALSLINPSLFEGWSNTVEEAKSLGVNLILSDIPVHREQHPNGSSFFKPDDAASLAAILRMVWDHRDSTEKRALIPCEEAEFQGKLTLFAKTYEKIVLEVLNPGGLHR